MRLIKNAYLAVNRNGKAVICGSKPVRFRDCWVIDKSIKKQPSDPDTLFFIGAYPRTISIKQTWEHEPLYIGDIVI